MYYVRTLEASSSFQESRANYVQINTSWISLSWEVNNAGPGQALLTCSL
jgi:hypothetical protein